MVIVAATEQQHQEDLIITDCETQKDMKRLVGARSICLDAYGTDPDGKNTILKSKDRKRGRPAPGKIPFQRDGCREPPFRAGI